MTVNTKDITFPCKKNKKSTFDLENCTFLIMRLFTMILILTITTTVYGQVNSAPKAPTFGTFYPVSSTESYNRDEWNSKNNIQQRNQQLIDYHEQKQKQRANMTKVADPHLTDEKYRKELQQQEMDFLLQTLNEVSTVNTYMKKTGAYKASEYQLSAKKYQQTFENLKSILEGQKELSLKGAYYQFEAAYGGLHLSYEEYSDIINKSVDFIKTWLTQNGYDLNDQEALHLGIQKFMGDTLTIKVRKTDNNNSFGSSVKHLPYYYDYIDYKAKDDFRNYFVTKTLATGTGQCNNLPALYLLLAEGLGAKAYLSFAPQHSFIKYLNNKGQIINYEPTINWHLTDQDYVKEMPVMTNAIQNRIYLDTLNKQQVVASLMIDLAYSFTQKHWLDNGVFVNNCVDYALNFFYQKNGNITAHMLKSYVYAAELDKLLYEKNITDLSQINQYPEVLSAFKKYRENERKIMLLGFQGFPESKYMAMLEKHDTRGKLQIAKKIDVKSKKNLFVIY